MKLEWEHRSPTLWVGEHGSLVVAEARYAEVGEVEGSVGAALRIMGGSAAARSPAGWYALATIGQGVWSRAIGPFRNETEAMRAAGFVVSAFRVHHVTSVQPAVLAVLALREHSRVLTQASRSATLPGGGASMSSTSEWERVWSEVKADQEERIATFAEKFYTHRAEWALKKLGPKMSMVGAQFTNMDWQEKRALSALREEVMPWMMRKVGSPEYEPNPAAIAHAAREYAKAAIAMLEQRLIQKLRVNLLTDPRVVVSASGDEFTVSGVDASGRRVRLEQRRILNQSSLGKLFNQWPARIYVDDQFVPEAVYMREVHEAAPLAEEIVDGLLVALRAWVRAYDEDQQRSENLRELDKWHGKFMVERPMLKLDFRGLASLAKYHPEPEFEDRLRKAWAVRRPEIERAVRAWPFLTRQKSFGSGPDTFKVDRIAVRAG